jgi:signal transduction histidine kinase
MGEWDHLDNRLVLGLEKGIRIIRREGSRWIDEGGDPRVTEGTRAIMSDSDGSLWITTKDATVFRLVPTADGRYDVRRYDSLSSVPVMKISNLHGRIVFSSRERIFEYDRMADTFRSARIFDPPLDARLSVGQMVTVDERSIAVRCEAEGFERFVAMAYRNDDGTYRLDSLKFRGIPDMEIYTLTVRDSQVFIGGSEGLFRYDIRRHPSHLPSYAAFVRQVVLREDSVLHTGSVPTIDYEWNSLTIHFSAASFYDEDVTLYSYRMEGLDEHWSTWSPVKRKEYANLFEGRYRFHLRARDANRHLSLIDTFEFVIAPPWYRTWWFGLSAFTAVLSLLWTAYRYRVNQLLRIERLRLQIASDLHDDVGSSLSKIALYSGLAESGVQDVEGRSLVKEIGRLSRETIATMSDIVWAIDARNDEDLAVRMRELAYGLLAPGGIAVTFDVRLEGELPADVRQNVYLIFKEAIHNIVKHSNARDVRIAAFRSNGQLHLTIRDDGDGIPVDHRQGHGLRNMRMRAERIDAQLAIDHRQGTAVALTVPL